MLCIECREAEVDTERSQFWCAPCDDLRRARITRELERMVACAEERERIGLGFGIVPPTSFERHELAEAGKVWRGPT